MRPPLVVRTPPKTRIEEAGVMNAELSHRRIIGNHLSSRVGRDAYFLSRPQDVEFSRLKHHRLLIVAKQRIPKLPRIIIAYLSEVNGRSVFFRLVAHDFRSFKTHQVHRESQSLRYHWV